jgi:hypothetical protein
MSDVGEGLLADLACSDPVYANGVAGIWNLGTNYSTCFFRWQPTKSENGLIRYGALLVQPRASFRQDQQIFGEELDRPKLQCVSAGMH